MIKWDIYQLDQDKARNGKDPDQAIDKTKDRRYYIILSPTAFNKSSKSVIAVPIQTRSGSRGTCVEIPGGSNSSAKIPYTSYAHCYSIYNLEKKDFCGSKIGYVHKVQQLEINSSLIDFFELWNILGSTP